MKKITVLYSILILILILTITSTYSFETTGEEGDVFNSFSASENFVNKYTGTVEFEKTLYTMTGPNGFSIPIKFKYSSNVSNKARAKNDIAPTEWLGLGWHFGFGSIVCKHNNTVTPDDDEYTWIAPEGYSLKVYKKGDSYFIEKRPYWKLTPVKGSTYITSWTLTFPDGSKNLYGTGATTTRYTFSWGNFVGETRFPAKPSVMPELYPYQWDLSEIRDNFGNNAIFNYEQKKEAVAVNSTGIWCTYYGWTDCEWSTADIDKYYTKNSWLRSIESPTMGKIVFDVIMKTDREYFDPYQSKAEPDNFMEFYDDFLLSKMSIYNPKNGKVEEINFDYQKINESIDGCFVKRVLTQIAEMDKDGNLFNSSRYQYNIDINKADELNAAYDINYHYGALSYMTDTKGSSARFDYNSYTLPFAFSTAISKPGKLKVKASYLNDGTSFVCATGNSKLYVYNWNGSNWEERTEVPPNPFSNDNSIAVDSVVAGLNYFIVCGAKRYCVYNWNGMKWELTFGPTETIKPFVCRAGENTAAIVYQTEDWEEHWRNRSNLDLFTWDSKNWLKHTEIVDCWVNKETSIGIARNKVYLSSAYQVYRYYFDGVQWNIGESINSSVPIGVAVFDNFAYVTIGYETIVDSWEGTKFIAAGGRDSDLPEVIYPASDFYVTSFDYRRQLTSDKWSDDSNLWKSQIFDHYYGMQIHRAKAYLDFFLSITKDYNYKLKLYNLDNNQLSLKYSQDINVNAFAKMGVDVTKNCVVIVDSAVNSGKFNTYIWNGKEWKKESYTNLIPKTGINSWALTYNTLAFGFDGEMRLFYKRQDKFKEDLNLYCVNKVTVMDEANNSLPLVTNYLYETSSAIFDTKYNCTKFNKVETVKANGKTIDYYYNKTANNNQSNTGDDQLFEGRIYKSESKSLTGVTVNQMDGKYTVHRKTEWPDAVYDVQLIEKTTEVDKLTQTNKVKYLLNGTQDINGISRLSNTKNSDGNELINVSIPAMEIGKYKVGMLAENKLSQGALTFTLKNGEEITNNTGWYNAIDKTNIRKATASTWSTKHNPNSIWAPCSTYEWNADMDATGTPVKNYVGFNFDNVTANLGWRYTGAVTKYNKYGQVLETEKPAQNGNMYAASIYGDKRSLPVATIQNAHYNECAVFTCAYDDGQDPSYFDKENGWAKGGSMYNEDMVNYLFGSDVLVDGTFGPTKNITLIDPNKSYTFSAWIYPRNDNPMRFTVEPHNNGSSAPSGSNYDNLVTGLQKNKWQFVSRKISSEKLKAWGLDGKNGDYLRIWIGNYCEAGSSDINKAYFDVQDIRFAPSNALITTTYYDACFGLPRVVVDANNNPGKRITYDKFGRPVQWEKYDLTKAPNEAGYLTTVMKKEYHLLDELLNNENIRVISPNGNETFQVDEDVSIRWTNRDVGDITISVVNADGSGEQTITSINGQQGVSEFTWTVPLLAAGAAKKIKITNATKNYSDLSDNPFTILSDNVFPLMDINNKIVSSLPVYLFELVKSDISLTNQAKLDATYKHISGKRVFKYQVNSDDLSTFNAVQMRPHVQNNGWMAWVNEGSTCGTTGQSKKLEAFNIISNASNTAPVPDIQYCVHIQNSGWQSCKTWGDIAGTTGQGLRIEAMQCRTSSSGYHIWYRGHVEGSGWQQWVSDGATAGTTGQRKRMEAFELYFLKYNN